MFLHNFWIMDASVSALVFLSAIYGEKMRRKGQSTLERTKPDNQEYQSTRLQETERELKLIQYLFLNFLYFAAMGLTVVVLQFFPSVMIALQHIAVVTFIVIAIAEWIPFKIGYLLGILFGAVWLLSVQTQFRWIINNLIIAMFAFLASHVQFRNFAFLQIFLWTALIYDVCLLARMNQTPQFLSVGECGNLLCQLFEMNSAWELPSVFTVRFGENESHVFLGTGDIIIGAIVANFAMWFFKSSRCLLGVVASYSTAIALLSQVENDRPYPALISIVPMCSFALVGCAVICRKTKRLFSLTTRKDSEDDCHDDQDFLVI
ncbi:uncharacterized protein [Montipora foliosa]|uniref:uncharacterized protein n=1 Tax=Montipora foliosa TaxID=591990 RepID=UPI0035F17A65